MGKKRRELAARFAGGAGHERDKLAVQPGFANQQTRGNRDTHPAILQDIDYEAGAAGSEFTIDTQLVFDACERGFDGRRLGVTFNGVSLGVKGAVFVDRQYDPAW